MNLNFSVEEMNLMCIYSAPNRSQIIENILADLANVDDPDMKQLMLNTIQRLRTLSDAEFSELELTPDWEDDPNEAELV